ncbi:lysophospholipid acyltransferase family protein [Tautonia plasticadhaerens]|uniref:1-acyl-sn-glycerol-3-phosphate acyltransferase n=1 Tax=Tautonia plasticadhaerens TaxID=2527974 RepID=A0A518HBW4_9BACT|nr:1-acyl-sn-glycerol-3-phosphate acyltransferase [Tautonia plasticadhaerens]QDV38341.1 1-acyl-sn-glycerol-3-phosphate acyltransferase [Tautonia plasticadhaerens]
MSVAEVPKSYVSPWLIRFFWPIHWAVMKFHFKVRIHHADRLPSRGPVILAPTHRTRWDTLMLYEAIRKAPRFRMLRFLTSHNEVARGVQGWFVRRLGAFPINTDRPTPGALKHCREILQSGHALVIFPEGNIYRLPPGEVHTLKPGTAWLSLLVQRDLGDDPLTIVPIRLTYSDRFLARGSTADVEVLPPLLVPDYAGRPRKEAIAALTADLQAALGDRVNDAPRPVVDAIARGEAPPSMAGSPGPDGRHDAA